MREDSKVEVMVEVVGRKKASKGGGMVIEKERITGDDRGHDG